MVGSEDSPLLSKQNNEYFELFINTFQCTIGIGYITASWGFAGASIIGGMLTMIAISFCNYYSVDVIIRGFKLYDTTEISVIFSHVEKYGNALLFSWNFTILFQCGLCCVAYNILFADLGPVFFPSYLNRFTSMLIVNLLFVAPMCMVRDLSKFAWTSVLGSLTLATLLLVLVYIIFLESSTQYICWFRISMANVVEANVIVQLNVMNCFVSSMYSSMKQPDSQLFRKVIKHVLVLVCILFPMTAFLGVYYGGPLVHSDFLLDFPDGYLTTIVQYVQIISLIVIYPLINRCVFLAAADFIPKMHDSYNISNLALILLYFFVAYFAPDLGFVYQLAGALGTLVLISIAPYALVHFGVVPVPDGYRTRLLICSIICVFVGVIGFLTGAHNFNDNSWTMVGSCPVDA